MTGYSAELLSAFASPSTGCTSTFTVVRGEGDLTEVGERHGLRLAGIDHVDRLRGHDRRRLLIDGQRDLDLHFLVVAGVLDGHGEGEIGAGSDDVVGVGLEHDLAEGPSSSTMPVPCRPPAVVPPSVSAPFTRSKTGSQ